MGWFRGDYLKEAYAGKGYTAKLLRGTYPVVH